MKNYINEGNLVRLTAPGAVSAGDVYEGVSRIGVYVDDAASGASAEVAFKGQYSLAALSTDTWAPGQALYWDAANDRLPDTIGSNIPAGIAGGTKTSGQTRARVIIG